MSIITVMKKLMAVFILLVLGIASAAIWYSPFSGKVSVYENNRAVSTVDGLCYAENACVRYDMTGSLDDMYSALDDIRATTVRTARSGNVVVVYAYSDRVCGKRLLRDGTAYNVMAAFRDGAIAIGAPMLQGSY